MIITDLGVIKQAGIFDNSIQTIKDFLNGVFAPGSESSGAEIEVDQGDQFGEAVENVEKYLQNAISKGMQLLEEKKTRSLHGEEIEEYYELARYFVEHLESLQAQLDNVINGIDIGNDPYLKQNIEKTRELLSGFNSSRKELTSIYEQIVNLPTGNATDAAESDIVSKPELLQEIKSLREDLDNLFIALRDKVTSVKDFNNYNSNASARFGGERSVYSVVEDKWYEPISLSDEFGGMQTIGNNIISVLCWYYYVKNVNDLSVSLPFQVLLDYKNCLNTIKFLMGLAVQTANAVGNIVQRPVRNVNKDKNVTIVTPEAETGKEPDIAPAKPGEGKIKGIEELMEHMQNMGKTYFGTSLEDVDAVPLDKNNKIELHNPGKSMHGNSESLFARLKLIYGMLKTIAQDPVGINKERIVDSIRVNIRFLDKSLKKLGQ